MSPRKSAQDELTKEAIISVARDLFVQEGYAAASMRKIADTLQCSHGAIYYHFKNKAQLFYEMVEADFQKLDQVLDSVLRKYADTSEQKLFNIFYGYIQFGLTHQKHYELMFLIRDDDVKSYLNEGPNKSYLHFAQAINSLAPEALSIKDIWSVFLSLHGFVTHYCRSETTFEEVKELASSHAQFLIKAIY
ncbi:TetR/AcrR family transcriptional regulator [Cytobacillus firmus]|uniref:TetR/AcrR family transcriptional regulator n=1 Tax=Cytobacillus firmus TaxID=1399 RepID=UPI002079A60F|nr:TetR/AcrR family transcriptional regulator [Cytobacillus firmus]USK39858.1 TetR/AcrR family transcriptional regulator [Cytobacillus firmus]